MYIIEKIKNSKTVNKNLVIILIIAFALLTVAGLSFINYCCNEIGLQEMKDNIKQNYEYEDGMDDVTGYGFIIESFSYGLNYFGNSILLIFGTTIPGIASLIIFVLSIVSRIIYSNENIKRLITYRIIMGFLIAFMVLFFLTYSLPFYTSKVVMVIVIDIFLIGVLFVLIKNTYSQRILK